MSRAPRTILVVCTANRGRSPMIAAILAAAAGRHGLAGEIAVDSAGLCAHELGRAGMPADPKVVDVCAAYGMDLTGHRARPLDRSLVEKAQVVIVMEAWQRQVLQTAFPPLAWKITTLSELSGEAEPTELEDVALKTEAEVEAFCARAMHYVAAAWDRLVERVRAGE